MTDVNTMKYFDGVDWVPFGPGDAPLEDVEAGTGSDDTIVITWPEDPGAEGYEVERQGLVVANNVLTNLYLDSGLQSDTEYDYRVRPKRPGVVVAWSATVRARTDTVPAQFRYGFASFSENVASGVTDEGRYGYATMSDNIGWGISDLGRHGNATLTENVV